MSKVFDFKEQLKVGDKGEALFEKHYREPLIKIPEHYADFRTTSGKILELKTDTYAMEKTPNFYIERWSDVATRKPGSVWQSRPLGVDILCYFYLNSNTYFEFTDLAKLETSLDKLIEKRSYIIIRNKWGISHGYKVPREALADQYTVHTLVPMADERSSDD